MTFNTVATFPGRAIIWNRVINSAGAIPKNIQWGTLQSLLNVTGSASANVNLFAPTTEARTPGDLDLDHLAARRHLPDHRHNNLPHRS